jgi:hypothetical protein
VDYWKQCHLKIQAVDAYDPATILKTTLAAVSVTPSGGSTSTLLADANGFMDFGWYNASAQVNIIAKYRGTIVNSTWQTSLYTISSVSVYQWAFEFRAYISATVAPPVGEATDSTRWNFTQYYVNLNTSATFTSGTITLYYANPSTSVASGTITSSFKLLTASGVSLPVGGSVFYNITDGYIWTRSGNVAYSVSVASFSDTVPSSWGAAFPTQVPYNYTNTAQASGTNLIVTHSFIEVLVLNPNSFAIVQVVDFVKYNASANAAQSGTLTVTLNAGLDAPFIFRLRVMQYLLNGSSKEIDHVDTLISVVGNPTGTSGPVQPVPITISFSVDYQIFHPDVNQTKTVDVDMPVTIGGHIDSLTIDTVTFNVPWITVISDLPASYGAVNQFTLRLRISPGADVQVQRYVVQPVFEGTVNLQSLWQPVLIVVTVWPGQPLAVQPSPFPILQAAAVAVTGVSTAVGLIRYLRKPTS